MRLVSDDDKLWQGRKCGVNAKSFKLLDCFDKLSATLAEG